MPSDDVYVNLVTETKKSVASLAKYAVAITAAMMAVKKGLAIAKDLQDSYFKQERAEAKLQNALKATNYAVGLSFGEMKKYATQMQKTTGIGDELILGAQGLMTTFTQVGKEVFPEAIKAAADMSVMFGQDLQQAVIQLGTALNDPIAGVGRLKKIGVSFSEDQTASIKKFMDQNDVMSAQAVILDELRVEFGGVADALGDTLEGRVNKLNAAFGNLKQVMGKTVAEEGKGVVAWLTRLLEKTTATSAAINAFEQAARGMGDVTGLSLPGQIAAMADQIVALEGGIARAKDQLADTRAERLGKIGPGGETYYSNKELERAIMLYEANLTGLKTAIVYKRAEAAAIAAVGQEQEKATAAALKALEADAALAADVVAETEAIIYLRKEFAFIDAQAEKWGETIDTTAAKNAVFGAVMSELAGKDFREYGNAIQRIAKAFKDDLNPAIAEYQKAGGGMIPAPVVSATRPTKGGGIRRFDPYAKGDPTENWQKAEAERVEKLTDLYEEYGKTLTNVFEQLGADIVKGENAWASFARAGLGAIAAVIEAFAAAEVAKAAAAFVKLDIAGGISSTIAAAGLSLAAGGIKNIPIMDNGGIVSSPTLALLAANGQPEQVTPLGRGGGGSNVTVHVYGTVQSENQLAGFVASVMGRSRRGY